MKIAIFKPVEGFKKCRWYRSPLLAFALAVGLAVGSCRTIQYVPIETGTTINVKDSTAIHYIDSIRIHEATRYRDMAWLGDTLKIEGLRSRMWATADTTKEVILGGLEEDKIEEKTRIVYKDREVLKDTTIYKKIPIEVEKVKVIAPRYVPWSLAFNFIFIFLSGFYIYTRLKKKL